MATSEVMLTDALDLDALEAAAQVRRIRDRLPGQTLGERIALVRSRYGRVYTLVELRAAASPQWCAWFRRRARGLMTPLEAYQSPISDEALLRYEDASETTWFSRFHVVAPTSPRAGQLARWIVGEVRGGTDLYAIVARWHTETGRAEQGPA